MPSLVTFPASAPHDEMMDVLNRDGAGSFSFPS